MTADSPAAFSSFQIQPVKTFPPKNSSDGADLTRDTLPQFIKDSNKSHKGIMQLHLWARSRQKGGTAHVRLPSLVVLRVTLLNVTTFFLKLTDRNDNDDTLTVESVVAFGPREKV